MVLAASCRKRLFLVALAVCLGLVPVLLVCACSSGEEAEAARSRSIEFAAGDVRDRPASDLEETSSEELSEDVSTEAITEVSVAIEGLFGAYGTNVAVYAAALDGTWEIAINADETFVSASMIKLLVLAEFMAEIDAGELSLGDVYTLSSADVVAGTGHINEYPLGTSFTYDDLARYMICYSDNTATNVLIDRMGMEAINTRAAELGLRATSLNRKMMDLSSGTENYMSARDAAEILVGIAERTIASEEMCVRGEGYLADQTDGEGLAQGIPSGVTFGNKTGSLSEYRHDAGIVYTERPYVIAFFSSVGIGTANELMGQVSALVYETADS